MDARRAGADGATQPQEHPPCPNASQTRALHSPRLPPADPCLPLVAAPLGPGHASESLLTPLIPHTSRHPAAKSVGSTVRMNQVGTHFSPPPVPPNGSMPPSPPHLNCPSQAPSGTNILDSGVTAADGPEGFPFYRLCISSRSIRSVPSSPNNSQLLINHQHAPLRSKYL